MGSRGMGRDKRESFREIERERDSERERKRYLITRSLMSPALRKHKSGPFRLKLCEIKPNTKVWRRRLERGWGSAGEGRKAWLPYFQKMPVENPCQRSVDIGPLLHRPCIICLIKALVG